MKKLGLTILFFLSTFVLLATHQKAAEITYQHREGRVFDFTLTTFTYSRSAADRPFLTIQWRGLTGGGDILRNVPRVYNPPRYVGNFTNENIYRFTIEFPNDGTFFISMEDPNRNGSVINLPNSINIPMFVETMLVISSAMGSNSSPILLNPPIDIGCLGIPFMHNPGAFDPDGDSLSFRFINCRGAGGLDIPGFRLPSASNSITLDAVTGDLIWDSPQTVGDFNIAILIEEFRNGVRIGSIMRDMQISIQVCDNRPPVLEIPDFLCVLAGDTLRVPVRATDPDVDDILTISANGEMLPNRTWISGNQTISPVYDTLELVFQHRHVRQQPHPIYFRVRDDGTPNLNTLGTTLIRVIGPPPQVDSIVPNFDYIALHWTPVSDEAVLGYRIYRARSKSGMVQDSCDFGMTDMAYQRIAEIRGDTTFVFRDSTVNQSFLYCYRIVRLYRNGTVSQMSGEFCITPLSNTPIIEKVSIVETSEFTGQIEISWRHPLDIDVLNNADYFRYVIHRSSGGNLVSLDTVFVQDTTFIDNAPALNTQDFPHSYKIELVQWQDTSASWESVGFSNVGTSTFISATGRNSRVNIAVLQTSPAWITDNFRIYRKYAWQTDADFAFVAETAVPHFLDENLINDTTYTYKIQAFGRHFDELLNTYVLTNWSQKVNATPTIGPPCRPIIDTLILTCDPEHLLWWDPLFDEDCDDFGLTYHVFFSPSITGHFEEIGRVTARYFVNRNVFVGCYFVVASNARNYRSEPSNTVCITLREFFDQCMDFELPNVFTPNNDGINDVFKAMPHSLGHLNMFFTIRIFNRWGNTVFESNDMNFEWDGNQRNGQPAPTGTYFWVVELGVPGGEIPANQLSGNVTLLR